MKTNKPEPVSAEPTWDHKGYTITLSSTGTFRAQINDKPIISGPSLDAVKKRINEATDLAFEPFKALELNMRSKEDPRVVAVSAVQKAVRGNRYSENSFIGETNPKKAYGKNAFRVLHPDTPECRAAYKAYMGAVAETARLEQERKTVERELFCKIPRLEASTFLESGNRLVVEYPQKD